MRPGHSPDGDDPPLVSLRGPDTDGSLVVSLGVALAVVLAVLATTAPAVAVGGLALVAAGYLLAGVRRRARAGLPRRRREVCVPGTSLCLEV